MNLNCFTHFVIRKPYITLTFIAVFSGCCLITTLFKGVPDFSDPQLGFETRATVIAKRLISWRNLIKATEPSGLLAVNPEEYYLQRKYEQLKQKKKWPKKGKKKKLRENENYANIVVSKGARNYTNDTNKSSISILKNLINPKITNIKHDIEIVQRNTEGFFCGPPSEGYIHLVLKSTTNSDLFTLKSIFAMCHIERELLHTMYYDDLCVFTTSKPPKCCRPWSLGNYIALLRNRTSCLNLMEEDVIYTKTLLQNCVKYYHDLKLAPNCYEDAKCEAPPECIYHDAVYNILNFITSSSFLPPNQSSEAVLKETMFYLPLACSTKAMPYYQHVKKLDLEFDGVSVVAMEFGLKSSLFDECLLRDAWFMTFGGMFILLSMWLYTGSLFLTIMTIIAIVFSLGVSYFMYVIIYKLRFFPFMNLLATVVATGIGADDAFIFCKLWQIRKNEKDRPLEDMMSETFHQAFFSMFVTCLTTAVAFFASYFSSITAIACFSIFAGTAVMWNYLFMISWFPACVMICDKSCHPYYYLIRSCFLASLQKVCCSRLFQLPCIFSTSWFRCKCSYLTKLWNAKERFLLNSITELRFFWLITLSAVALSSAVVVFYYPRLELPTSQEFQLFDSSHPFEQYDLVYKHKFWFERIKKDDMEMSKLPLRFVWGVLPVDNGDHLNPESTGTLEFDPTFDISHPESQTWLLKFCRSLRRQPFYQSTLGPLLPNCFIESFLSLMQRRCFDPFDEVDRTPCCEVSTFPYNSSVFNRCIVEAIGDLYQTPSEYFLPGVAGPKFSKDQNSTIKAIVIEYDSNYSYSMSYSYMHEFYTQVENWMNEELKTAPATMKNGWFVSELDFYDLQKELSEGTLMAIIMSMGLALVVLLLSTLNVLTSLYAIVTITFSILVTMAILVLLGWKLNILESIAISTAIGLTVDFSLHYTVHYRLVPQGIAKDRVAATRHALGNMAGPVCMAAITTGAAGAFMMPSLVLAYVEIGMFLVIVMTVSWIYATFHLGAMLAIAGPENQCGQFKYSHLTSWFYNSKQSRARGNGPTTSSGSDIHELDSLTSKDIRPLNRQLHRSLTESRSRYPCTDQSPSATSAITIITTEDN